MSERPTAPRPSWVDAYKELCREAIQAGWRAPQRHLAVAGMKILVPHA